MGPNFLALRARNKARRTDLTDEMKPYVGQAKSEDRFIAHQAEHQRDHPDSLFEFEQIDRCQPGVELDRLEEFHIRNEGGPTNKGNPDGGLSNMRHQRSDVRYNDAGGSPY